MAKSPKAPLVDHELIHELTKLLDETGLTEIEIEQDGQRVRVARGAVAPAAPAPRAVSARAAPQLVGESAPAPLDPAKHPGVVISPMVGTAYGAPEPGAKPFIEIGSTCEGRRYAADHRSDEDHEPDSGAARRHRDPDSVRGRPAGRIRRAVGHHRVTAR